MFPQGKAKQTLKKLQGSSRESCLADSGRTIQRFLKSIKSGYQCTVCLISLADLAVHIVAILTHSSVCCFQRMVKDPFFSM